MNFTTEANISTKQSELIFIDIGNIKREKSYTLETPPPFKQESIARGERKSKDSKIKEKGPRKGRDFDIFETKVDADYHPKHMSRFYKGINIELQTICPDCDTKFCNPYVLREHIRYKHIGNKFNWYLCEYKATRKGQIKFHIETIHFCVRFPCN